MLIFLYKSAGPLALAREVLGKDSAPFFVLNSDVTCSYPFEALRDFHLAHGGEGTIMVTKVDEPSSFGVVLQVPGSTAIDRFVEKPKEFVGNKINAGIYIFNPSILERIEVNGFPRSFNAIVRSKLTNSFLSFAPLRSSLLRSNKKLSLPWLPTVNSMPSI